MAQQHNTFSTTVAVRQKRQLGKRVVSEVAYMQVPGMIIQGHGKYDAFRLDKALVNSESGNGQNDRHGHRGGRVARPGNTSSP